MIHQDNIKQESIKMEKMTYRFVAFEGFPNPIKPQRT